MMRLLKWWRSLSFYWQVYLFTIFAFGGIILVVEMILEPIFEYSLFGVVDLDWDWYEAPLWIVSIIFPALLFGYMFTSMVRKKMESLDAATAQLARGDLKVRIPVENGRNDVFGRLARSFNGMANALERHIANEKRLMADISHELRSPLARMNVAISLLAKKRDGPDAQRKLELLEGEIEHMSELVALLLEQGRDRSAMREVRGTLDLSALIDEAVRRHEASARDFGKRILATVEPNLRISGYAAGVNQMLDNVLENAIFYAPAESEIHLNAGVEGEKIATRIRDFGPGVPPGNLADIFRAFFRVDSSRARHSGGSGLGLALARDAALDMGGEIEAKNADPGLEVTITLPRDDDSS